MATDFQDKGKETTSSQNKDMDKTEKSLKAELSSESLPADWDKGPVVKLVGKNFHEVVLDTRKDVFVDFYAEWCGFCRILEPIWIKLGEHFKSSSDVVIAKIDGSLNDLPDVDLSTFPSLRLYRRGDNKVFEFTKQNRSLFKLIAFVENGGQLSPSPHESDEDEDDKDKDHDSENGLKSIVSPKMSKEDLDAEFKDPHKENIPVEEHSEKTKRRPKSKKPSIKKENLVKK